MPMGRNKIDAEKKKVRMSVGIENNVLTRLNKLNIKRSRIINWLLNEYFNKK